MRFGSIVPSFSRGTPAAASDPFTMLQREIDRVFDEFTRGFGEITPALSKVEAWAPRVDVSDEKDALTVTADLPGVSEKDIECTFADGVLTIKGEKKTEKEEKKKDYYVSERSYGSFYRAIPLPVAVDENKIQASFADGVLRVRLPKTAEAKTAEKKIAIKTGDSEKAGSKAA